jgi:hypothetical protein
MAEQPDDEMFFPPGVPEEMKEHILNQRRRQKMELDDTLHQFHNMFEEMNLDHLALISALFHNLQSSPAAMGWWEGTIDATLARRRKVCPACGKNHDDEIKRLQEEEAAALDPESGDMSTRGDRLIQMYEYHVEAVDDDDLTGAVFCTGVISDQGPCGRVWPNLEDRILRRPDECDGCQLRSAHG